MAAAQFPRSRARVPEIVLVTLLETLRGRADHDVRQFEIDPLRASEVKYLP